MSEPTSAQEYTERFHANQRITGFGIDGVRIHVPCPFCAAPDWLVHGVLETETVMQRNTTCRECGRSSQAIVERDPSGIQFEFVQTGGPEQPDWLVPHMRRING